MTLEGRERRLAYDLTKAATQRWEYCRARVALEEARILDRAGDYVTASAKFGEAAQIFQALIQTSLSDSEKNEMKLVATLSKGWQMMTCGEAEASPEMFVQASRAFEEAMSLSLSDTSKMQALGHSHLCRALEAGTLLASTLDLKHHASAQKHLESATNCYQKAGFQKASEHARATKLLFDAYVHIYEASVERDPGKKVKSYAMAEKLLQASAESYVKADKPARNDEVEKLLVRVQKDRELAVSLTEALHAPGITSAIATFQAPSPTYEKAVGVEKFEDAIVQALLIVPRKVVRVGEELELQIELVNAGNKLAQLLRLEGVIPENFEVKEKPSIYQIEGPHLNPKGRRLGPMKTETVRLVLTPTQQGRVRLTPRILYLAESGRHMSSTPEPVELTIGENEAETASGSPKAVQSTSDFHFQSTEAKTAFAYLVKEFSRDYMERRLYVEKAGWRGLMDLVRDLELPRRALYGDGAQKGRVVKELEHRGLIETRIFPGERGRGGDVTRVRVAYQTELVKRYVDSYILEGR